jgi:hypothetical protein
MQIGCKSKTKKPSHFCEGFLLLAPPIGESYNFNAMVIYLTIIKTRVNKLLFVAII